MNTLLYDLFEGLSDQLTAIENKHSIGNDDEEAIPEFEVVAGLDYKEKVEKSGQTGDLSGKIASLNDRFRKSDPNKDCDIPGEWLWLEETKALPGPTKAALRRIIQGYGDEEFEDVPLHNFGTFEHDTKGKTLTVEWQIKIYEDDTLVAEAANPDDSIKSYRVLAIGHTEKAQVA